MTINCAERGLLLLRVRDEIRMTIAAYQTLYESSIAFGMRSALMSEQRKAELEAKVSLWLCVHMGGRAPYRAKCEGHRSSNCKRSVLIWSGKWRV